jgi:hypothetical protein
MSAGSNRRASLPLKPDRKRYGWRNETIGHLHFHVIGQGQVVPRKGLEPSRP